MKTSGHPLAILSLLFLTISATGCYRSSEATVNGEAIHQEEFYSALKLAHGHKMLQRLITQKLIAQEAKKRNIALSPEEMKPFLDEIQKNTDDESMALMLEQEIQSRLYLRKILMSDITEDRLQELYKLFAEDLAQREVYVMRCANKAEAQVVESGLKAGEPFHLLAAAHGKYQADKHNGGFRGSFTRAQIAQLWGITIAEQLNERKANFQLPIFEANGDWTIFYTGNIRHTFEELRPTIEEMVMSAKRPEFVYKLLVNAKITSPYLTNPKRLPAVTLFQDEPLPWEKSGYKPPVIQAPLPPPSETPSQANPEATQQNSVTSPEENLQIK